MVANKIFEDPRNVNFVFCYTDTELPADSIVTINGTPAYISSIYTAQDGWQPGATSSNQGVIGFNYLGSGFTYGDTFNITNSSYTFSVSGYAPGPSYGYLNFTADRANSGAFYPGSNIYAEQNYLNVGTGDFTIEFLVNLSTLDSYQAFVSFEGAGGFPSSAKFSIDFESGGINVYNPSFTNYNFGGSFQTNTWYHIAIVRSSGVLYFYQDGELQYTQNWVYDYSDITTTRFGVVDVYGYYGLTTVFGLAGSMSNIRITANEALYTSNFSPPTLPLTAGPNTTVLMLASSDANKYVNSVDNVVFTNVNNPATNEPVTYSPGPIPYPPPPPVYYVYWNPPTDTMTWYTQWDRNGAGYPFTTSLIFNTTTPGFNNFSQVLGLYFNDSGTNISSLTGLQYLTNLQYLGITTNPQNSLSSLDISQNPNLTKIDLGYIPTLSSLDTSNNLLLSSLQIYECGVSELNLNNNSQLRELSISNVLLKSINIGNLTQLTNFSLNYNQLSSIQGLQNLDNVSYFYLQYNAFSAIDIFDMNSLQYAYLNYNDLSSINFSGCPVLYWLSLNGNNFTEVPDFSSTSLALLTLNSNFIREYNPSYTSSYLERIDISFNYTLTSVILSNFSNLHKVDLYYCSLSSLDLSFINEPQEINVNNNNLTSLSLPVSTNPGWGINANVNISNNPDLTTTSVSGIKRIAFLEAEFCSFPQSVVDRLFDEVANNVYQTNINYGYIFIGYGNNAAPSSASSYSRSLLLAHNWTLYYN